MPFAVFSKIHRFHSLFILFLSFNACCPTAFSPNSVKLHSATGVQHKLEIEWAPLKLSFVKQPGIIGYTCYSGLGKMHKGVNMKYKCWNIFQSDQEYIPNKQVV